MDVRAGVQLRSDAAPWMAAASSNQRVKPK
jgi:hypothetical protein